MIDNGVGDLIRITEALPPEQWEAAARMLGFERATPAAATTVEPLKVEPAPTPVEDAAPSRQREPASVPESALAALTPTSIDTDSATTVSWLQSTTAMAAPPPNNPTLVATSQPVAAPEFEPLLPRRTAAGVIAALLATSRDGALDTRRAVQAIAGRRPLRRLPRRQRPTLARGAVVLTDTGDGLAPFAPDVAAMHEMISSILGPARVKVGWFTNDPALGVWLDRQLIPVESMDPETPVVILTDLGLINTRTRSRAATLADMESIGARLGDRVHAVALVPVPRDQLQPSRLVGVVPWERPTLGEVRQARRTATSGR